MSQPDRSAAWKWVVCGLLLFATMLLYMDRQTLAQTSPALTRDLDLNKAQYGRRLLPWVADTTSPPDHFWQQLAVLNSTQCELPADDQWRRIAHLLGFLVCRVILGVFEAGHWPCALVTTQRILTRQQLPLGNSILQSGASVGSIVTPFVVLACRTQLPGHWPYPFFIIGLIGLTWVVPWFLLIRGRDLPRAGTLPPEDAPPPARTGSTPHPR